MERDYSVYQNPLIERYSSREMIELFSPQRKFRTWRLLWIALAQAEKELAIRLTSLFGDSLTLIRSYTKLVGKSRKLATKDVTLVP